LTHLPMLLEKAAYIYVLKAMDLVNSSLTKDVDLSRICNVTNSCQLPLSVCLSVCLCILLYILNAGQLSVITPCCSAVML